MRQPPRDLALPFLALVGVFLVGVERHWFLSDDAFISFRYARNLAEGYGLVFNPGERVEGYTNFAWVLAMAAVLRAGLPVETVANLLGVAAGIGVLALLVGFSLRGSGPRDPLVWLAAAALVLNRSFTAWSTGGLATQAFSLLLFAAFVAFVGERERGETRPWRSALLFAAAYLTRPEAAAQFGVAAVFFAADVLWLRRRPPAALARWLAVFLPIVLAHELWRLAYYGALLPNTFYAKVSGLWLDQGAAYLGLFLADHALAPLLLLPLVLVVARRDFASGLFAAVLATQAAYLLAIGGDRFEFRFLVPFLPYLFWMLQEGLRELVARLPGAPSARGPRVVLALGVVAILFCAFRPSLLDYRAFDAEGRYRIARLEGIARYAERRAEEGRFLRGLVDSGHLAPDTWIAVGGAGALPYYAGLPTLDFRGLNDATIARQPLAGDRRGRVAHEKSASLAYLRQRGVAIYDVLNRIVQEGSACPPATVERDFYRGPVRCVQAKGRTLAFATTLSDEAFARVFARFHIVR